MKKQITQIKEIDGNSKTLIKEFKEALKDGRDLTINCREGQFVLKSGVLLKITKESIYCWDGKTWRNLN